MTISCKYRGKLLWFTLFLSYLLLVVLAALRPEFGGRFTEEMLQRLFPGLPSHMLPVAATGIRKVIHIAAYAGLVFVLIRLHAGFSPNRRPTVRHLIAAGGIALAVAVLDELLQLVSHYRMAQSRDIAFDLAGIVTGLLITRGKRSGQ